MVKMQDGSFLHCGDSLEFFFCRRRWKELCYQGATDSKVASWTQIQGQAWWLYKVATE